MSSWPPCGASASPILQNPDAVTLLGEVGQPEVEEERPDDHLGAGIVEAVELVLERAPCGRVPGPSAHRTTARPGDQPAEVDADLLLDDVGEEAP